MQGLPAILLLLNGMHQGIITEEPQTAKVKCALMQLKKYGIIGTLCITTHNDAMGCLTLEPRGALRAGSRVSAEPKLTGQQTKTSFAYMSAMHERGVVYNGYLTGVVILSFSGYEVIVPQPGSWLECGVMTQRWKRLMCAENLLCCSCQIADLVFSVCSHTSA